MDTLSTLPYTVLKEIAEYLDGESRVHLSSTCDHIRDIIPVHDLTIYPYVLFHNCCDIYLCKSNILLMQYYDNDMLENLFTLCPHIKTLTINDIYCCTHSPSTVIIPQHGHFLTKLEINNIYPINTIEIPKFPVLTTLIVNVQCDTLTIRETPLLTTLHVTMKGINHPIMRYYHITCIIMDGSNLYDVSLSNVTKISDNFEFMIPQLKILHIYNNKHDHIKYIKSNKEMKFENADNLTELCVMCYKCCNAEFPSKLPNLTRLKLRCIPFNSNNICYIPKIEWIQINVYSLEKAQAFISNSVNQKSIDFEVVCSKNQSCYIFHASPLDYSITSQDPNNDDHIILRYPSSTIIKIHTVHDLHNVNYQNNDVIIDKAHIEYFEFNDYRNIVNRIDHMERVKIKGLHVVRASSHYLFSMKNKEPSSIVQIKYCIPQLASFDTLCIKEDIKNDTTLKGINISNVKYLNTHVHTYIPTGLVNLKAVTIYIPMDILLIDSMKTSVKLKYPNALIKYKITKFKK